MTKLMEKLQKAHDTLEWKLAGVALNSFVGGLVVSDIPRAISERNYALAGTELILASMFGYGAYRESKKVAENYKR